MQGEEESEAVGEGIARFARYRLPPGRHGLPRELVAENQRWRLLGACAETVAEYGYGSITSAKVARRAGVSSSTFYEYFDNLEECVTATQEIAAAGVLAAISSACENEANPAVRLQSGVAAALEFTVSEPALARVLFPGVPTGARERLLTRLAALLHKSRGVPDKETSPSLPHADPVLIAAALGLIATRLARRGKGQLSALAPELAELLGLSAQGRIAQ